VKPDLGVSVGSVDFKNPVLTASGTFGYGLEFQPFFDICRLGGMVTKGLSLKPRAGNPPVRIVETPSGMLNSIGLQNIGIEAFLAERLPQLRELDLAVVLNLFGETLDEYVELCERLEGNAGIAAVELNVSCPNVDKGGMVFGTDAKALAELTVVCRKATRLPLWVKLSPNVTDIAEMARAAEGAGADALSLVNTYQGMSIDVQRRRPALYRTSGGLSGPAIRPLAVWATWCTSQAVSIPLIGMGGIMTARDALEFILVGASAIQVGTASFMNPQAAVDVVEQLEAYLVEHDIASIRELIGTLELNRC
jgi:dihydroorotate dehydrogenase (NAD+) catalytic subunit